MPATTKPKSCFAQIPRLIVNAFMAVTEKRSEECEAIVDEEKTGGFK